MPPTYDPARLIARANDPYTPWEDIGRLIAAAEREGDMATARELSHIEYLKYKRRHD